MSEPTFEDELTALISQHHMAFKTNTPPYLLARFMIEAAVAFESTLTARALYFRQPTGIEDYPYDSPDSG